MLIRPARDGNPPSRWGGGPCRRAPGRHDLELCRRHTTAPARTANSTSICGPTRTSPASIPTGAPRSSPNGPPGISWPNTVAATTLTSVLPGAVFGPIRSDRNVGSVQVIGRLLAGLPGVPRIGLNVVDVRDVADLHIRAMQAPAAAGERFIAVGGFLWMSQVAAELRRRLGPDARSVPTRTLPNAAVRLLARFRPEMRGIVPMLGPRYAYTHRQGPHGAGLAPATGGDHRRRLCPQPPRARRRLTGQLDGRKILSGRKLRRPADRRVNPTPTRHTTPPAMASGGGHSASSSADMTMVIGGTRYVVTPNRPASIRARAYPQVGTPGPSAPRPGRPARSPRRYRRAAVRGAAHR